MKKLAALFCLLSVVLTARAQGAEVNGCSSEAFKATEAVAIINGSDTVRITTKTMIAGKEIEPGVFQYTYTYRPYLNEELQTGSYKTTVRNSEVGCRVINIDVEVPESF
ncbi:MAG: hypothetical protein SGJ18_12070 [Pseudomonadota bacterium]|nr:hypothetical protein [Pseudomonadota bacterium]